MIQFPRFTQWKQIFKVLKRSEQIILLTFLALSISSLCFLAASLYFSNTKSVPSFGGTYKEGIVGQPRFINPIYGETNDVDRSLIDLVFSGLMTYDKDGNIVKDLAKSYIISGDGKTYTFTLNDNILWHDGHKLTADDVIFTIKTIQNSDYKSPLRANWIDVDTEKISDNSLRLVLKQPYNSFLENCTLKIIPAHIWQNILPENFTLSAYNLQPIGSGPFSFSNLVQTKTGFVETLNLQSNRRYFGSPSFISSISFKFFATIDDLAKSASSGQIDGFTLEAVDKTGTDTIGKKINRSWLGNNTFSPYHFSLPRYFAVFFNNQKTSLFSDPNVRKALTYATNKPDLLGKINAQSTLEKDAIKAADSPILSDFYGFAAPSNPYAFDTVKAGALLDAAGFKLNSQGQREKDVKKQAAFQFKNYLKVGSKGNDVTLLQGCLTRLDDNFKALLEGETNGAYGKGTENAVTEFQKKYLPGANPTGETGEGTRTKLNELCTTPSPTTQSLSFTLVTINQPQLVQTANILKAYWQSVGVSVTINAASISELKTIIKNRSYDALLYGETLGMEPDIYPFWYSSQKIDPGLNLSEYENKDADKLLKDARQAVDENQKTAALEKLQQMILADAPALFLYNPDYLYWIHDTVNRIDTTKIADPAKRFSNVTNWFLNTKRVWK
ncbi:peptidoglycan-binding protein [Candidatus Parcubacteria bacterium]|nr:peptidoglycan-binding protein [Candidatus Parcubacteria bacterium]